MPTSTVADEDDDVEMEPESNVVSEKTVSVNELSGLQYMTQIQARDHLRKLWENEKDILISVLGALNISTCDEQSPIDIFFLDVLPVTPPRFRPVSLHYFIILSVYFLPGLVFYNINASFIYHEIL